MSGFLLKASNWLFSRPIHVNVTGYHTQKISVILLKRLPLSKFIVFWENLSLFWEFPFHKWCETSSTVKIHQLKKLLLIWAFPSIKNNADFKLCHAWFLFFPLPSFSHHSLGDIRWHPLAIANLLLPFTKILTRILNILQVPWHYLVVSLSCLIVHGVIIIIIVIFYINFLQYVIEKEMQSCRWSNTSQPLSLTITHLIWYQV